MLSGMNSPTTAGDIRKNVAHKRNSLFIFAAKNNIANAFLLRFLKSNMHNLADDYGALFSPRESFLS